MLVTDFSMEEIFFRRLDASSGHRNRITEILFYIKKIIDGVDSTTFSLRRWNERVTIFPVHRKLYKIIRALTISETITVDYTITTLRVCMYITVRLLLT